MKIATATCQSGEGRHEAKHTLPPLPGDKKYRVGRLWPTGWIGGFRGHLD